MPAVRWPDRAAASTSAGSPPCRHPPAWHPARSSGPSWGPGRLVEPREAIPSPILDRAGLGLPVGLVGVHRYQIGQPVASAPARLVDDARIPDSVQVGAPVEPAD